MNLDLTGSFSTFYEIADRMGLFPIGQFKNQYFNFILGRYKHLEIGLVVQMKASRSCIFKGPKLDMRLLDT